MDLEDQLHREAFSEGWEMGLAEARADGTVLGVEAGCVAGMRVGYIRGYMQVLDRLRTRLDVSQRAARSVDAVNEMLADVDLDTLDDDQITKLEARFQVMTKQLGISPLGVSTASLVPSTHSSKCGGCGEAVEKPAAIGPALDF